MANATGGARPSAPQYSTTKSAPKRTAGVASSADEARRQSMAREQRMKNMSPEDKAFLKLMEKYKYDVTAIPGWNGGKGTR